MPDQDWFTQNAPSATASSDQGDWFAQNSPGASKEPPAPKGSAFVRTLKGIADVVNPIPGIKQAYNNMIPQQGDSAGTLIKKGARSLMGPLGAVIPEMVQGQYRQGQQAVEAAKQGRYSEALGHGVAAMLPGVGPMAATAGETIGGVPEMPPDQTSQYEGAPRQPDIARGMGQTGALVGSVVGPKLLPKRTPAVGKIASTLTPEEAAAVQEFKQRGGVMDAATETGSPLLQGAKEILRKQPGSASKLAKFDLQQNQSLADVGNQVAREISPTGSGSKVAAGANLRSGYEGSIAALDAEADAAYSKLRALYPQNKQKVQVGTTTSPLVGPNGQPLQVPIFQELEMPVATQGPKSALAPIVKSIEKSIPLAQQQSSPGLSALRQIMDRPDYVDMDTAIRDLSSIQNIARLAPGEHSALRGAAKGIAAAAVGPYRQAIDAAAQSAGPDAVAALQEGRIATKAKYEQGAVLKALPKGPAQVVRMLSSGDNTSLNLLRQVQASRPGDIPDVARSVVQSIVDRSTQNGGFEKAQGALAKWNSIGQETKDVLYSPKQQQSINNFFRAARMIGENPNPSGTASVGSLSATGALMMHHPITGAITLIGGRQLANLLMDPNGAAMAARGLTVPLQSPAAAMTYSQIMNAASAPPALQSPEQQ